MKSLEAIRKGDFIDQLIIDCNKSDFPSNPLLSNEIFLQLFSEYLSNFNSTILLDDKEDRIFELLNTKYFNSLSKEAKFKLLNDYSENSLPPIYYLGLHKADNILWYLFNEELVDFDSVAIETLFIRQNQRAAGNSYSASLIDNKAKDSNSTNLEEDINDPKGKSKIEEDPFKKEKEIFAESFQENFLLSLALYLDKAKLNKSQLALLLESKKNIFKVELKLLNKTIISLFVKTLNDLIPNLAKFDLNDKDLKNLLIDKILELPVDQQRTIFLARQFDITFNHAFYGSLQVRENNSLFSVLAVIKESINHNNTNLNQKLFENTLNFIKGRLSIIYDNNKRRPRKNFSISLDSLNESLINLINECNNSEDIFLIIYFTLLGADLNSYHQISTSYDYLDKKYPSRSSLEIASLQGKIPLIHFLIAFGADPNHHHPDTKIPLLIRAVNNKNKIEILKFLIKYGADINSSDPDGKTLLFHTAYGNRIDLLNYLIDKNVNVNALDRNGGNALHYILYNASIDTDVIKLLLKVSINVNQKNLYNITPLHCAQFIKIEVLKMNFVEAIKTFDIIIKLLEEHAGKNIESSTLPPAISNNDNIAQQYITGSSRAHIEQSRGI